MSPKHIAGNVDLLLVTADPANSDLFTGLASRYARDFVHVDHASSSAEADEMLTGKNYDLCLVDMGIGETTSFDLVEIGLRTAPVTPVILLAGSEHDEELETHAVMSGASDLLYPDEFEALTFHRVMHMALLRRTANADLMDDALRDALTGAFNRARMESTLVHEFGRREREPQQSEVGLVFVDLDKFKQINDEHGHAAGDDVLQRVAHALRDNVRLTDVVARCGGDEFVVVLAGSNLSAAEQTADKLLTALRALSENDRIVIAASIGVASSDQGLETPTDLLRAADSAALVSKRNGGDSCSTWVAPSDAEA